MSRAARCGNCATQTVFGEGPLDAEIMFVGEQPGDQEDLAGRAFVGPGRAGLRPCAGEAGIDRTRLYITNAVKHFKFEPRGKRRIHAKPMPGEIDACRWWIDQERALVRPKLVIAMGVTAVRSLIGRAVTIGASKARRRRWRTARPATLPFTRATCCACRPRWMQTPSSSAMSPTFAARSPA